MNKENNLNDLSSKFQNVSISSGRITRSKSRLIPPNKINKKESINIIKEEKIDIIKEKKIDIIAPKIKNVEIKFEKINLNIDKEIIVGREIEISKISEFLDHFFSSSANGSLYVSGSPGTGKTAVVTTLLASLETARKCVYHLITCMDFSNPMKVFSVLWTMISNKEISNSSRAVTEIEEYLTKRSTKELPLVIVLDEIDQLTTSNQRILYKIFKWLDLAKCKLIIIGIANTLDLTETKLPDIILESYRPQHINFPPYNEKELSAIIMSRVKVELSESEKLGVTLCSKKVSSKSGDARIALDLYKRAATISEDDQLSLLRAESTEVINKTSTTHLKRVLSTPQLLSMRRSQFLTPCSPSIKHVSRAIKEVEKTSNPYKNIVNAETGQSTLPLHHKLVLCAALVLSKKSKTKNTMGQLYDMYTKVCSTQHLEDLGMSELVNICDLLDTRALMKVGSHKEIRQKTFILNLDESGIQSALSDNSMLSSIMESLC